MREHNKSNFYNKDFIYDDKTFCDNAEVGHIAHSNAKNNNNVLQDSILSPGVRLRNAREENQTSVKETANQLFLQTFVVRALENDKYEVLPPTVFVRGYLRNYAKLQGIPLDSITNSFEEMVEKQPTLSPVIPQLKPYLMQSKLIIDPDLWPIIGIFMVFVTALLGLTALWPLHPIEISVPESLSSYSFSSKPVEPSIVSPATVDKIAPKVNWVITHPPTEIPKKPDTISPTVSDQENVQVALKNGQAFAP